MEGWPHEHERRLWPGTGEGGGHIHTLAQSDTVVKEETFYTCLASKARHTSTSADTGPGLATGGGAGARLATLPVPPPAPLVAGGTLIAATSKSGGNCEHNRGEVLSTF